MIKHLVVIRYTSYFLLTANLVYGQQAKIDTSTYGHWPRLVNMAISNNGKYASYNVYTSSTKDSYTLNLCSTTSKFKKEFTDVSPYSQAFSDDSKYLSYTNVKNELIIYDLFLKRQKIFGKTKKFKLITTSKSDFIVTLSTENQLMISDLTSEKQFSYENVEDFYYSPTSPDNVWIKTYKKDGVGLTAFMKKLDLESTKLISIWQGKNCDNIIINGNGNLVFISRNNEGRKSDVVYLYNSHIFILTKIFDSSIFDDKAVILSKLRGTSFDETKLFFEIKKTVLSPKSSTDAIVNVWSYNDEKIQPLQMQELKQGRQFLYEYNLTEKNLFPLETDSETAVLRDGNSFNDSLILVKHYGRGDLGEWNWNKTSLCSIYSISTQTGRKKLIGDKIPEPLLSSFSLSPDFKHILYFDHTIRNYISYNTATGSKTNLTAKLNVQWTQFDRQEKDIPLAEIIPKGMAGWAGPNIVLLYDNYDIWKIDLTDNTSPVCLTNGTGEKERIVFGVINTSSSRIIDLKKDLLLRAFDIKTMDDGYYKLNRNKELIKLYSGPYIFCGPDHSENVEMIMPVKAKNREAYLVRRMSSSESPNVFYTDNFKQFRPLSTIAPEKQYVYIKSELAKWLSLNGHQLKGILYKPSNFDPSKKYPVIIHYYQKYSESLNMYYEPKYAIGDFNIPTYVSKGYLVFLPDIYYEFGKPGESAYNSVISAANYLSKLQFVDSTRMGLQGHSFGGYQTNYVVAHSNKFAAAVSASGWSDMIGSYFSIMPDGHARSRQQELYKGVIGNPSTVPDQYIANSPIYKIKNISTPMLLMHNYNDSQIDFRLGVEYYLGLRRLGKKCWLLQYDNEDHTLQGSASIDYSLRTLQFFNHYLMNQPAPEWMINGIPAINKGLYDGLKLDSVGRKPEASQLIDQP